MKIKQYGTEHIKKKNYKLYFLGHWSGILNYEFVKPIEPEPGIRSANNSGVEPLAVFAK